MHWRTCCLWYRASSDRFLRPDRARSNGSTANPTLTGPQAQRSCRWTGDTVLLHGHARTPTFLQVRLIGLDGGNDLLGQEVDPVHGGVVGHQALAAPEDHVARVHDVDD